MPASGERFRAAHILIATGGAPFRGATIPGIEHAISSNEAFYLPQLPRRVLAQGGGYIAVEFACIFAGLGSEVTVVYRGENVLRGFDDGLRNHLRKEMESRGIRFECCRVVSRIEKGPNGYSVSLDDSEGRAIGVEVDTVMFAIGRRPNTAGLGLESVGVETTPIGAVVVDAFSRTNVPNIYAVGDVTNRVNLTPVAIREGHAFADSVFGGKPTQVDHANVATAVFSEPELGVVGLTEAQAMETLKIVQVYEASFRPMKSTLSGRETRVLMKLIVDGVSKQVVGCHIAGPDAGELAQVLGIAVKMRATKADFDATMAVHPTMAEELVTLREVTRTHVRSAAAAE
jgi:glutathione reductase (NADPH)